MSDTTQAGRSWARTGCLGVSAVALVAAVVGLGLSAVAFVQNRSTTTETRRLEQPLPEVAPPDAHDQGEPAPPASASTVVPTPNRVVLDVAVGQVTVLPGPPGSPIRVDGIFDPERFELLHDPVRDAAGGWMAHIVLRPLGSEAWALFRLKVGAQPPRVRIVLPRGVPFRLEGSIRKGLAAMELGGLWVRSADLDVQGGNVEVSFIEPTQEPMQHLNVKVTGGLMEVAQLGNASPRRVSLVQRLGALDLDFRGPWQQDTEVRIDGRTAGGTIWLPADMRLEGIDRPPIRALHPPEVERPTLHLTLDVRPNQVLLID